MDNRSTAVARLDNVETGNADTPPPPPGDDINPSPVREEHRLPGSNSACARGSEGDFAPQDDRKPSTEPSGYRLETSEPQTSGRTATRVCEDQPEGRRTGDLEPSTGREKHRPVGETCAPPITAAPDRTLSGRRNWKPAGPPEHIARFEARRARPPKPPPERTLIGSLRMRRSVLVQIEETIGARPAETGGMLLSNSRDYTVTDFVFDRSARISGASYNPDTDFLNLQLLGREEEFVGIVHSHPPAYRRLSEQDLRAAWSNLTSPSNPHLHAYLMPLVMTKPDTGRFTLLPFIVTCHPDGDGRVQVRAVELDLID